MLTAILGFIGLFAIPAAGQERIADDPQMIIGKLDNGMTYYIRHNSKPEGCADFYIVHDVGALQEEDHQNGLAHFLEHMAFNGTRHYPGQQMMDFLTREGLRLGYNVNAFTSRTETVYNLSRIPLARESFVDSVLMVLHDWSGEISCIEEALDAERGVISEEWRRADEPRRRMADMQTKLIYKGSRQAERTVLGTLEVINGFKREDILDFYHKWYRPDLQAVVVVGDFDVETMERKVKELFSRIPKAENPEPKVKHKAPALDEPLFENMFDPQVNFMAFKAIHKHTFPSEEVRNTDAFFKDQFSRQIVSSVMEARLRRDSKMKDSPVAAAVLVTNPSADDFYTSMFTFTIKDAGLMEEAFAFYAREVEKMLRFGFSEDEFKAAKFRVFKKNRFNQETFASETTSEDIVKMCREHFLRGFACADPYEYKQIQKTILSELDYEDVKGYEKKVFGDSEVIYSYCVNDRKADIVPSQERMEHILSEVREEELRPDFLSYDKIDMESDPQPGKIVKRKKLKGADTEEWTLGNGVKVYYTPSEEVKSTYHISMNAFFDTGYKALDRSEINSSKVAVSYMDRNMGFRGHDKAAIADSPECSGVRMNAVVGIPAAWMRLQADRNSLETAFRMLYLSLTEPYFGREANLKKFVQNNVRNLKDRDTDMEKFSSEMRSVRYGDNPWRGKIDSSDVVSTDMKLVEDVFRRSFGKLDGMEVYIVSDFDRSEVVALVEKYIASLDMEYDFSMSDYYGNAPAYKGRNTLERTYGIKTVPKSTVEYFFKADVKPVPRNEICIDLMKYILADRYRRQIREARGGTYHVSFMTERFLEDGDAVEAVVSFQTRPELLEVLLQDVEDEMERISVTAPSEEEMEAARRYLSKKHHEQDRTKSNDLAHRNQKIYNFVEFGLAADFDYDAVMNDIGAKEVSRMAARFAKGDRLKTVYSENN